MDIPWVIFALIAIVSISLSTLFARVLMKEEESNPIASSILFQFMIGGYCLLFALALKKFVMPTGDVSLFRFLLSAIFWALSTLFTFKAIKLLGASETSILVAGNALFITVLGVIFLKEILTFKSVLGIVLILLAILFVNKEHLSFKSKKGIFYALLVAFFSGVAVVNDVVLIREYESFSFTTLMSFLPGIILAIVFPKELIKVRKLLNIKEFRIMALLTFFYAIQALAFYVAYGQGAPVSRMSTFTKSSIVLTVILAAIFLKEKSNLAKKAVAALMVTLGAILLS